MRREQPTAFDLWLRGSLIHEHGSAVAEPVPEDLLRLLPCDEASPRN